jgi:hypothetical protein
MRALFLSPRLSLFRTALIGGAIAVMGSSAVVAENCSGEVFREVKRPNCINVTMAGQLCNMPTSWRVADAKPEDNYTRLTVPPRFTVVFHGTSEYKKPIGFADLIAYAKNDAKDAPEDLEVLEHYQELGGACHVVVGAYRYKVDSGWSGSKHRTVKHAVLVLIKKKQDVLVFAIRTGGGIYKPSLEGLDRVKNTLMSNLAIGSPT